MAEIKEVEDPYLERSIQGIVENALCEDIGPRDITTSLLIDTELKAQARIIGEEDIVLCGLSVAEKVFRTLDPEISFESFHRDGDSLTKGTPIAVARGRACSLLSGERVALNFLQRLSGIATLTRKYVKAVSDLPVKIVDTRKTTPGLRILEKYAVRIGGGGNHRLGLFDGILVKENHLILTGGIKRAIGQIRQRNPFLKIEVEADTLDNVEEAIDAGADIIMLDNMDVETMKKAVALIKKRDSSIIVEASGNVRLENVRDIASTGIDIISAGALIHRARWVDISMDVEALNND